MEASLNDSADPKLIQFLFDTGSHYVSLEGLEIRDHTVSASQQS